MKFYLKIGLLIFLLMIISGSTVVLNVDEEFDRESSKIYMAEGTGFYEVKVDNFSINRTIDLDGTSVDMYYNSETGNLYGTVGAVNRLHRINTTDFTIEETFDGFNHNVQDVVASSHRNEIYATSTDNTIRKLSAENMEQIDIIEYNDTVFEVEYHKETETLYPYVSDRSIKKVDANNFEEIDEIIGFPQATRKGTIDERNETIFYGGHRGTIYSIEISDFERYDTFDELPSHKYNTLEYDVPFYTLDVSYRNGINNEFIHMDYSNSHNKVYAGTSNGKLYEINADSLEVERTYNVTDNRNIEYDYSEYDSIPSSSLDEDDFIYEDDVRGVKLGVEEDYLYITTAPGALIEIDLETFEEIRRMNTNPEDRTVHIEVK